MVSPFDLSQTFLVDGLLVHFSLPGTMFDLLSKQLKQMATMVPGQDGQFQSTNNCASPNNSTMLKL